MSTRTVVSCVALALVATSLSVAQPSPAGPSSVQSAGDQKPSVPERVAALKQSLAESQKNLRSYEWIETTVVTMKGEEKSNTQQRCYYGADGKLQKVPLAPAPEEKQARGIRGKIAEKKKAELTGYMKQAVELVKKYVPPDHDAIEKVKNAGNISVAVLDPGKRVRLDLTNYLIPGDSLKVEMTLADNRLAAISVDSFLEGEEGSSDKKDPVAVKVRMGTLTDGTTYAEETVLDAEAKHLKVTVSNSGYRKMGS